MGATARTRTIDFLKTEEEEEGKKTVSGLVQGTFYRKPWFLHLNEE